jgi:hypothetical protein
MFNFLLHKYEVRCSTHEVSCCTNHKFLAAQIWSILLHMKFLAAQTLSFLLHKYEVSCCTFFCGRREWGNELDVFGLFKLTHFSTRKKGYMPNVQSAIISLFSYASCFQLLILNCSKLQMLFAGFLLDWNGESVGCSPNWRWRTKACKSGCSWCPPWKVQNNTFLQNVGIVCGRPRSSAKSVQARLEVEIRANGDCWRWIYVNLEYFLYIGFDYDL